jgi:hypothetical protein
MPLELTSLALSQVTALGGLLAVCDGYENSCPPGIPFLEVFRLSPLLDWASG